EVAIKEPDRLAEDPRHRGLPFVPVVGFEIATGHASTRAGKRVKVLAEGSGKVPDGVRVELVTSGVRVGPQVPAEVLTGIRNVILTIAPAGEVADDPALSLRLGPFRGPAQTQLGLSHARGPRYHRQGTGDQTSSEVPVERVDPKPLSRHDHPNSRSEKEK